MHLTPRHIQNFSEASSLEPHWGYADRALPCTNDAGSCQYLDVVYHSHDLGMLYCGIIWATILGMLFIWCVYTYASPKASEQLSPIPYREDSIPVVGKIERLKRSVASYRRQYLLPEFAWPIFGRTTRLQLLVLVALTGYLTVFSFVGIVYNTWVTPVKKMPGVYDTRTSLGPWSDRIGVLAYALTPLSVLLSSRESILSLITGMPYQSFNFLHRWLGYIIVVQSSLHTVSWCVVEMRLYQPQPEVGREWIAQLYMIWGVIAMFILFVLFILSTPWAIKRTGYEFFRKSHYVLAMLYIGACWGHWQQLKCYLIPALSVWFIDRGIRLIRTGLLHYKYIDGSSTMAFQSINAAITQFPDSLNGNVVRLDFKHLQDPWAVGQHFYLTFSKSSIWQSHPFTPLNVPISQAGGVQHSYIFRAKSGETAKIASLAGVSTNTPSEKSSTNPTTPIILSGPYGVSEVDTLSSNNNILCIAGGTGITYALPVLLSQITACGCSSVRKLQLIWAIRHKSDMKWVQPELDRLYEASKSLDLNIRIFVTREDLSNDSDVKLSRTNKTLIINEKDILPSSSSSSGSSTNITAVAGGCCASKTDREIDLCTPNVSRSQPITIEQRGSLGTAPPEVRHPDLHNLVHEFVEGTINGPTTVFASGPGGMISDLRRIVAGVNDGAKVWKGDLRRCVELKCDDRLEW